MGLSVFFFSLGGGESSPKTFETFFPLRKNSPHFEKEQKQSSNSKGEERPPQAPLNFKFFPYLEKTKKKKHLNPAGAGVYNYYRGHNPAGVGVKKIIRGHDPGGVGVKK